MNKKNVICVMTGALMVGMTSIGILTQTVSADIELPSTTISATKVSRYISEIYNFDFSDQDGGGQGGQQSLQKYNLSGQNSNITSDFNLWVNSTNGATLIKGALINTTELPSGKYALTIFNKDTSYFKASNLKLVIQYTNGQKEYKENAFSRTLDGYLGTEINLKNAAHIGFQYDGAVAKSSLHFTGYSIEG